MSNMIGRQEDSGSGARASSSTPEASPSAETPEEKIGWGDALVILSTERDVLRARLLEELAEELQKAKPVDRPFLERLLKLLDSPKLELPPFPDVAEQLDEILKDKRTSVNQIAEVVERDPGMVRRVWARASSALYATPPRSLKHSVSRIGMDALWRIGMDVCTGDDLFKVKGFQAEADAARGAGVVAAGVAAWICGEPRGPMYMAGLLHSVGKLILYQTAGDRRRKEPAPSKELVERLSKRHYVAFGGLVAINWKLDPVVIGGVAFHAAPESAPPEVARCAKVLHAAVVATHTASRERAADQAEGLELLESIEDLDFDPKAAVAKAAELLVESRRQTTSSRRARRFRRR